MARIPTYEDDNGSPKQLAQAPKGLNGALNNLEGMGTDSGVLLKYNEFGNASETVSWTAPFNLRVTNLMTVKTGGAGGVGDNVTLKNGATTISVVDLNALTTNNSKPGTLVVSAAIVAKGTVLSLINTKAAGDSACASYIMYIEV